MKGPAKERDRQAFPEFSLDFPPELLAKLQEIEWGKNKYGRGPRLAAERESALHQMLFWLVVVVARLTRFPARRLQKRGFEKKKTASGPVIGADIFCMPLNFPFSSPFGWLFLSPHKMALNGGVLFCRFK